MPTKFIVAALGTWGDVLPAFGIALALQRKGLDVEVHSSPYYQEHLSECGLQFFAIGNLDDFRAALVDPRLWRETENVAVYRDYFLQSGLSSLPDRTLAYPKDQDLFFIAHPMLVCSVNLVKQLRANVRVCTYLLSPAHSSEDRQVMSFRSTVLPKVFPRFALRAFKKTLSSLYVDTVLLEDINHHRRARGLPRIKSYLDEIHDTPEFHLNLFPQWFAPSLHAPPPRILQGDFVLHTRTPSKELGPDLERFIAGGDRPVAFLFGQCAQGLRRTIEDIARHYPGPSRRAVVITADRTLLPEVLPEHLHWAPYAPLDTLLAACKGIVHYGGIGTMAQALKAATPQIALPFIFDQYENSIHMSRLGVGEVIPASRANGQKIRALADRLFQSEAVRRRCQAVAERFTLQDPTDAIADLLVSAARSVAARE